MADSVTEARLKVVVEGEGQIDSLNKKLAGVGKGAAGGVKIPVTPVLAPGAVLKTVGGAPLKVPVQPQSTSGVPAIRGRGPAPSALELMGGAGALIPPKTGLRAVMASIGATLKSVGSAVDKGLGAALRAVGPAVLGIGKALAGLTVGFVRLGASMLSTVGYLFRMSGGFILLGSVLGAAVTAVATLVSGMGAFKLAMASAKQTLSDFFELAQRGFRNGKETLAARDLSKALLGEGAEGAMSKFRETIESVRTGDVSKSQAEGLAKLGVTRKRIRAEAGKLDRDQQAADLIKRGSERFWKIQDTIRDLEMKPQTKARGASITKLRLQAKDLTNTMTDVFGEEFAKAAVTRRPEEINTLQQKLEAAAKLGSGLTTEQKRPAAVALDTAAQALEASLAALRERFGTKLIPTITNLVDTLNQKVGELGPGIADKLAEWAQKWISTIQGFVSSITPEGLEAKFTAIGTVLGTIGDAAVTAAGALQTLASAIQALMHPIDTLNRVGQKTPEQLAAAQAGTAPPETRGEQVTSALVSGFADASTGITNAGQSANASIVAAADSISAKGREAQAALQAVSWAAQAQQAGAIIAAAMSAAVANANIKVNVTGGQGLAATGKLPPSVGADAVVP